MVVRPAKRARRPAKKKSPAGSSAKTTRSRAPRKADTARAGRKTRAARVNGNGRKASPREPKTIVITGRVSAPAVRLGMTPLEVRQCSGKPECILFGSDDHVEWQFGTRGVDVVGAPTLYVTALKFAAGRVVRITERMADPA